MEKAVFKFDEATHSYFLNDKPMTGCTTILGCLAKPALIPWAASQATEYIKANCKLVDGFYQVSEDQLKEAKVAHSKFRDKRAVEGTDAHSLIENWVKTCIEDFDGKPNATWKADSSIRPFVEWAQKEGIRFLASETQFYSESLFVAGTADLLFEKDGKRFVGDIKNKKKIYGREAFFQCSGYGLMAVEMGEKPFDGYCVIRVWENEVEALWGYDVEGDTEAFKACVLLYRAINKNY